MNNAVVKSDKIPTGLHPHHRQVEKMLEQRAVKALHLFPRKVGLGELAFKQEHRIRANNEVVWLCVARPTIILKVEPLAGEEPAVQLPLGQKLFQVPADFALIRQSPCPSPA